MNNIHNNPPQIETNFWEHNLRGHKGGEATDNFPYIIQMNQCNTLITSTWLDIHYNQYCSCFGFFSFQCRLLPRGHHWEFWANQTGTKRNQTKNIPFYKCKFYCSTCNVVGIFISPHAIVCWCIEGGGFESSHQQLGNVVVDDLCGLFV